MTTEHDAVFDYFVDHHAAWLDVAYTTGIDQHLTCCGAPEHEWRPPAQRDLDSHDLAVFLRQALWRVTDPYVAAIDCELRELDPVRAHRPWRHDIDIEMAGAWARAGDDFAAAVEEEAVRRFLVTWFADEGDDAIAARLEDYRANRNPRPVVHEVAR